MSIEKDIKSTISLPESRKAIINLIYTTNWIKEQLIQNLKPFDISMEQYNVLRILRGQKGNPANLCTIQERMINKMSNTTRLVDKLIKKNLVTRQQCEMNRRKVEIFITTNGLQLLSEIDIILDQNEPIITGNLPDNELQQLNILLDKLRS
ncbi:MAG: MarR family transcriptional regulator [Bacteroidetes bacterium MedPE-SWsnd-G2]|nr:MAG: MarR family transcriptional regulator [Bacteroidetes bacterium MedPE-SWsnd-G2]